MFIRIALAILISLLLSMPAKAQQIQMEQVIPAEMGDITKNIHVVIDVSSSLDASEVSMALNMALEIATQGVDDFNLAITIFAADSMRMSVVDENCDLGPNWMAMPSEEHAESIAEWLNTRSVDVSATDLGSAIQPILNESIEDLTVIVITDGQLWYSRMSDRRLITLDEDINSFMGDREVSMGYIGIEADCEPGSSLYNLASRTNGFLFNLKRAE